MRIIIFTTLLVSLASIFDMNSKNWPREKVDLMFFFLGVYGHCTDFPTSPTEGREVLEIDTEDPSDNGPDVAGPDVVTNIATD